MFDSTADQIRLLFPEKYKNLTHQQVRKSAVGWLEKNGDFEYNDTDSINLRNWYYFHPLPHLLYLTPFSFLFQY